MSRLRGGSIGLRIALVALTVALISIAIVGAGVWLIGGQTFAELMASHGQDAVVAHDMFDEALGNVLALAIVVAAAIALLLALFAGERLGRPLADIGRAARRIAAGDYAARLPRRGSEELVSVADSFNQMAGALEEQEALRREFIANAAHELRTPLTNLQGYLEALRDGVIQPDRQAFESLWEETDRLVRLSHSLDQLAQGADERPMVHEQLDLSAILRGAIELARPSAQAAGLDIDAEGAPELAALGDPDVISQVMANLLNNAVRYTPRGGRISIRWAARPNDILVSVANTGDGIPPADLAHVFERFYRVEKSRDRARGGAGIGLAIVRQLVEAGGGRVGAESSNELTRFWFTVPVT